MSKLTYSEQLKHPNWQRKRLEVMSRDDFTCQRCGDTKNTLNVHHRLYIKGREVWDYGGETLVTLCEPCHQEESMVSESVWRLLVTLFPKYAVQTDTDRLDALSWSAQTGFAGKDGLSNEEASQFSFCVGWLCHLFSKGTPEAKAEIEALAGKFADLYNEGSKESA